MAAPSPPAIAPITVLTPVRRIWSWWLRLSWPPADRNRWISPWIKRPLLALSFIHAAHWGLIDRLPAAGPRRRARRLPVPYVVFQSNFDGPPREYAEAFAIKVAWRINGLWRGGYGFPGPRPQARFVDYVMRHALDGPFHYYSAYPTGTVRTVGAALALEESFGRFRSEAAGLDAEAFAEAWREFLTREQRKL
jgi:hypothetical protein